MKTYLIYSMAAIAEIAGCYSFWAWLKLGRPAWWVVPGVASLVLFAYLLTLVDAYGAIYIAASIVWLWLVEKQSPDLADMIGVSICMVGAAVILFGRTWVR